MNGGIKVIKWVDRLDDDQKISCGGLGGFVNGHKWEDYLKQFSEETHVYLNALKDEIIENEIRTTGETKKSPIFNDNSGGSFSWRAWGDLMAAIYNTKENTTKYGYMDFYM